MKDEMGKPCSTDWEDNKYTILVEIPKGKRLLVEPCIDKIVQNAKFYV
jgi:hypothetical protein